MSSLYRMTKNIIFFFKSKNLELKRLSCIIPVGLYKREIEGTMTTKEEKERSYQKQSVREISNSYTAGFEEELWTMITALQTGNEKTVDYCLELLKGGAASQQFGFRAVKRIWDF